jgi:hypothetical protein
MRTECALTCSATIAVNLLIKYYKSDQDMGGALAERMGENVCGGLVKKPLRKVTTWKT